MPASDEALSDGLGVRNVKDETAESGVTSSGARWRPEIPLSAVISGRAFLAVLEGLVLWAIVAIVSKIADLGMTSDSAFAFALTAAIIREALDATCMRVIMRIRRSQDFKGGPAAICSFIWPIIAGAVASLVVMPEHFWLLTATVWVSYALLTLRLEKPWDTTLNYAEMKRRSRAVRVMTREVFAEEIRDERINLPPLPPDEDELEEETRERGDH